MGGFIQSVGGWEMILGCFILFLVILIVYLWIKVHRMDARYKVLMGQLSNPDLDKNLQTYYQKVVEQQNHISDIKNKIELHEVALENCLQKIGVVRYNAFENTGSAQSFVIALLDGKQNGVVINSVFGRDSSVMFSKPIVRGNCNHHLSDEEKEALKIALNSHTKESE